MTREKTHKEIYEDLKKRGHILFETVIGSQAHGTSTPKSDVDISFVYIAPKEWLLNKNYDYHEFLKLDKDTTGYELQNFIELVRKNNPTILEVLFSPEDCHILKHRAFDALLRERDRFLSKVCKSSVFGYANSQIRKASGMDKMQNWEKDRTEKKEPIDFCFVIDGYRTTPFTEFIKERDLKEENFGVVRIDHAPNMFALFYGEDLGYKGIFDGNGKIVTSSVPKGEEMVALVSYNEDAYKMHNKDWRSYQTWLENRNKNRWVETSSGNAIDGKNIAHLVRLTQMNREIASGQGFNVRRPNREEILAIKNGEKPLGEIIQWCRDQEAEINQLYDSSDLPEEVDIDVARQIMNRVQTLFYDVYTDLDPEYFMPTNQEYIDLYNNNFIK